MKSIMLVLTLLAGFNAFASTIDGYSLPITGAQTEENFTMNTVQTRTEYRNETQANTCFRTVLVGYRTECREEPRVVCYQDPRHGQICTTRFERHCYSVPDYRQEAYTCYQTVRVPYEVFSHNVRANVNVKVTKTPGEVVNNSCGINFSLIGTAFKSVANCSEFIVLAKNTNEENRVGDTLIQDRKLDLTLLDAAAVSAPTRNGIKEMRVEGQTLVFRTGDLTKNPNFTLKLFVERIKLLQGDETLINRTLAPSEYSFEKTSADSGLVKINLSNLIGGINKKKKHVLKVDLNVLVDTTGSINATLPTLSASESITVNE